MSASLVVDASVALAWCFSEEGTPATAALLEQLADKAALVPGLWHVELADALIVAERRGRISGARIAEFVGLLETLDIETDGEWVGRCFTHIAALCRAHQLTAYDAVYLDLAARRRLPLATLDEALAKAAGRAGVELALR